MVDVQTRPGLPGEIFIQIFALKLRIKVAAQIVSDTVWAVTTVAIRPERFSKGVMDGGVEGAGHHQRAKRRNRRLFHRHRSGSREKQRLHMMVELNRVARTAV